MQRTFKTDQLTVQVYESSAALGEAAAQFVAETINRTIQDAGEARVIFATGNSQLQFLEALLRHPVNWGHVTAFHLDEYLNLPETHPASFRRYLREKLFDKVVMKAVHLLNGEAPDAEAEARRYADLLNAAPVHLACIGIGENGHIAFNDPPADFNAPSPVHIVTLDDISRRQQVGEGHFPTFDDVPAQALSLSVPGILNAQAIACIVPEARKAEAVRRTLQEPVSPDIPASILRQHPNTTLFLDPDSAGQIP
ncbi:MAG: glucosamine-6-phosphate deaminase [Anaerolineae bacterium]